VTFQEKKHYTGNYKFYFLCFISEIVFVYSRPYTIFLTDYIGILIIPKKKCIAGIFFHWLDAKSNKKECLGYRQSLDTFQ
jgi:hypothetical protein